MLKTWIAAASVFAMMSGAAFAQSTTSETSSSSQTTTPAPATGTYESHKSQTSTDGYGGETKKTQDSMSDSSGTKKVGTSVTTGPDGSKVSVTKEQHTVTPQADTTTTNQSSSTTTTH